jgi:hypothetical protein
MLEIRVTEEIRGLEHKGFRVFRDTEVSRVIEVYRVILEIKETEVSKVLVLDL